MNKNLIPAKVNYIKPIAVLILICIVVAALLGGVYMLTKDRIAQQQIDAANEAKTKVLPGAKNFKDLTSKLTSEYPDGVSSMFSTDKGYIFEVSVRGKDAMVIMCGISLDGKVVGVEAVSENETPDYKKNVFPLVFGTEGSYKDMTADTLEAELVSGATLTSNGIYNAVKASLDAYALISSGTTGSGDNSGDNSGDSSTAGPEIDADTLALLKALVSGATFADITPADSESYTKEYLKALYRVSCGRGYVAHVVVNSTYYNRVESEALIHIGTDGKIVNISKLAFKTSDKVEGERPFTPPTDAAVDAFYAGLNGQDSESIDGVDLITGATSTSTSVVNSFKEALAAANAAYEADKPRDDLGELIKELVGEGVDTADVTPAYLETLKKVYRLSGGRGYVAYVVVNSTYYDRVESEALIHIGTDGKIKNIERLTFKTSDEGYGFTPPASDAVDAFYAGLNGASSSTIGEVDLITGATSTSTGVRESFSEALSAIDAIRKADMPRADIEELAENLVGEGITLADITPADIDGYVKKIYRAAGGRGYVAHVVVISAYYGTIESEALIHVGANGKIVNIEKLTFKTSEAYGDFVPPTDAAVDAFYAGLNGASSSTIGSVDLITGATNTASGVVSSFTEALSEIDEIRRKDMPRTEDEIKTLVGQLVGEQTEIVDLTPEDATYVKKVYSAGDAGYVAYVVVFSEHYGTVESEELILVDGNGKVKEILTLTFKTSDAGWGFVPPAEDVVADFYDGLMGASSSTIGSVDLITGATSTTTAVRSSFAEALLAIDAIRAQDMPTPEDEIKTLAAELIGSDVELVDVTPDDTEYIKRIYRAGNKGYVAYVVVLSSYYGTVESETLIHVDGNGKVAAVKRITFKTSDEGYGFVPPSENAVNNFYAGLVGASSSTIGSVDLITGATNTTGGVQKSFEEALREIDTLRRADLPRGEDEIKDLAEKLIGEGTSLVDITPDSSSYVKRLYKDEGGRGFVAYVLVMSSNYAGQVESEALIYVDKHGNIKDINKLVFKTSDAIYGYVPPTEAAVNAFYARLVGKNAESLPNVDLITGATNTSTSVVNSFSEALELVAPLTTPDYAARIVGIVILALALSATVAIVIVNRKRRSVE